MNKLFLSLIICFGVVCANETNEGSWDSSGVYIKSGVGAMPPFPYGALGLGFYHKFQGNVALDLSAMADVGILHNSLDVKLLLIPTPGKRVHIGVGPVYLKDVGLFAYADSLGGAILFRKVNPESQNFFQIEISQPLFILQEQKCYIMPCEGGIGLGGGNKIPRINIMFGHRF